MPLPQLSSRLQGTCLWLFGFAFRAPEEALRALLPAPLTLITHGGFGFWHVAFAEYERLRTGFLGAKGAGHVVTYSLYARLGDTVGLFPVRAETDIVRLSSWSAFPAPRCVFSVDDDGYGTVDLFLLETDQPAQARLDTRLRPSLALGSPFTSLSEAAHYLQSPTCTLRVDEDGKVFGAFFTRTLSHNTARLLSVPLSQWQLLSAPETALELAFELKPHSCTWEKDCPLLAPLS